MANAKNSKKSKDEKDLNTDKNTSSEGYSEKKSDQIMSELEQEIIHEACRIAKNEVSSCYTLMIKAKELMSIKKALQD